MSCSCASDFSRRLEADMAKPARLAYPRPALGALVLSILTFLPHVLTAQDPPAWLQEIEGRWWNAFLIPHEDRYFIHNEQGDLIFAEMSQNG